MTNSCRSCINIYQNFRYSQTIKSTKIPKTKHERVEQRKLWRKNNPDKIKIIRENYYNKNKDTILKKNKDRKIKEWDSYLAKLRKRRKEDPLYRLTQVMRSAVYKSLNNRGFIKNNRTFEIIGCTKEDFKEYIESKWENWMSWENHGKYDGEFNSGWDLDHIIPLSIAKTQEDIIRLNHYTNFQPLCSKINRHIKRDRI